MSVYMPSGAVNVYEVLDEPEADLFGTAVEVVELTSTKFVVFYDRSTTRTINAVVGIVKNNGEIVYGREVVVFEYADSDRGVTMRAVRITNRAVMLVYEAGVFSGSSFDCYLEAVMCNLAGSNYLAVGGAVSIELETNTRFPFDIDYLGQRGSLHYVTLAYFLRPQSNVESPLILRTLTTSGGNVVGASAQTTTEDDGFIKNEKTPSVVTLTNSIGVVSWTINDAGSPDNFTRFAKVFRYAGGYTFGTRDDSINPGFQFNSMAKATSTKFVSIYQEFCRAVTINPSTLAIVTVGAELDTGLNATSVSHHRQALYVGEDHIMRCILDFNDNDIIAAGIEVDGTTCSVSSTRTLYTNIPDNLDDPTIAILSPNRFVAGFDYTPDGTTFDIRTLTSQYAVSTDPQVKGMGVSVAGNYAFITAWTNGFVILNKVDMTLGTQVDSIIIGYATLSEINARTYVAYPLAISGTQVIVFGRIDTGFSTAHVMITEDAGSNFEILVDSWGRDRAMAVVAESLDDFYVMRCSSIRSRLYKNTLGNIQFVSELPFNGPIEPHGMRLSLVDGSIVVAAGDDGFTETVVYSYPPYFTWSDITNNHPQTKVNAIAPL